MSEFLSLAVPATAGLMLGAIFFGGLWWTVFRAVTSKQPALWFLGSNLLRTGVVLGGFYLVGGGRWERLLLCLLGFVLARLVVWWLTRSPAQGRSAQATEASHAP